MASSLRPSTFTGAWRSRLCAHRTIEPCPGAEGSSSKGPAIQLAKGSKSGPALTLQSQWPKGGSRLQRGKTDCRPFDGWASSSKVGLNGYVRGESETQCVVDIVVVDRGKSAVRVAILE